LDSHLAERGEVSIRDTRKPRWRIINPHGHTVTLPVRLYVEFWDYFDGVCFGADTNCEMVNEKTGEKLDCQLTRIARAWELELVLSLKPHEELTAAMHILPPATPGTVQNHAYVGAEGVRDILQPGQFRTDGEQVETDDFVLCFDQQKGIASLLDKHTKQSLLDPAAAYAAFSGIYEVTPIRTNACDERRRMGRNRKTTATKRYESRLIDIKVHDAGTVFVGVELDYALEGTRFYQVFLKVYRHTPLIETKVRIHKTSEWAPENLYISLPFSAGKEETRYIEKTGALIRPGIDQLPGTNQLFYLIQNGVIFSKNDCSLVLSIKDTPLITLGSLEARPIDLSKDTNWDLNRAPVFAWVMNNFWETNFKVDLGGFYEFSFALSVHRKVETAQARDICAAQNEGVVSFNIGDE
jgi:hypothetical protein